MISSATVHSAIVLMNRRMKVDRGVITFVPVCSSVEDMHLHHLGGTNQAQAQTCRVSAQYDSTATGGTHFSRHGVGRRGERRRFNALLPFILVLPEMLQLGDIAVCPWRARRRVHQSSFIHSTTERWGKRRGEPRLSIGFRTACKTLLLFS